MGEKKQEKERKGAVALLPSGGAGVSQLVRLLNSQLVVIATITAALTIGMIGTKDIIEREPENRSIGSELTPAATTSAYDPTVVKNLPGVATSGKSALEMAYDANSQALAAAQAAEGIPPVTGSLDSMAPDAPADEEYVELSAAETAAFEGDAVADEENEEAPANVLNKNSMSAAKFRARPRLTGGPNLQGGVGRGFDKIYKPAPRSAKALRSVRTTGARRVTSARGKSLRRGSNTQRLKDMNKAMAHSRRATGASVATTHNQQWTGASANTGSIGGSGTTGDATAGQSIENAGTVSAQASGPLTTQSPTQTTDPTPPSVGNSENKTPYQKLIDVAVILLPVAAVLLLMAYSLKANPAAAKMAAYAATAVAGIVTALGVGIAAQGQMLQGGLIASVGGLLTFLSFTAATNPDAAAAGAAAESNAAGHASQAHVALK
jgi:hypothetical protein